ncbi:MAG: hypothetical protein ACLS4S_16070 [Bacteroides nordii]|jgi:hypothetical protein
MEQKRNKFWRKQQCFRVFKARMILFATYECCIFDEEGNRVINPHWFELAKQHWCQVYKTTGTPCSCMLCQGNRYNQLDYKRNTCRIINEEMED